MSQMESLVQQLDEERRVQALAEVKEFWIKIIPHQKFYPVTYTDQLCRDWWKRFGHGEMPEWLR